MKKSTVNKLSNSYLFGRIKTDLPVRRKLSKLEARIVLKDNRDRLIHKPKTRNFRFFWTLAREAFQREDYNEAYHQINKTMELLPQSSLSKNHQNHPNDLENTKANDLDKAKISELAGKIYKRSYRIQDSIVLLERSLGILNNTLGEDTVYTQNLIAELAESYLINYRGKAAIFYYDKFLKLKKTQFLKYDKIDMLVMVSKGLAYEFMSGPKTTLRLYKKILRLNQECLRRYKTIQFFIIRQIGRIYLEARKMDKAKKYYMLCLNEMGRCYLEKKISKQEIHDLLIDYYRMLGMHDRSLYFAKKSIKDLMQLKKDNYLEIIAQYVSFYLNYLEKNDKVKAIHYFKKFLGLLKKIVGTRHPMFLRNSIQYADILCNYKGLYRKSLKRLKNIKKELKEVFELNMNLKAEYKLRKGGIYSNLNWTKKSSKKLKEAKKLHIEHFGRNHPFYILCCYEIGQNLHCQDYPDKALAICKTVLESIQRIYSYFHIYCANSLLQIATIYKDKGRVSLSLEYYKRGLDIYKKLNFRNNYQIKTIYLSISELYLQSADYQRFFYYLEKCNHIEADNSLRIHEYHDQFLFVNSRYFCQVGNYEAARKVILKYLHIFINSDRYNHSDAIKVIADLADFEIMIGGKRSYAKGNKLFQLSKNLYTKLIEKHKIPEKNTLIVEIYTLKAELYKQLGKNEDCLKTLKHALDLKRHFYHKNDYQMLDLYYKTMNALFETNRYYEYIQLCRRALKIQLNTINNLQQISAIYSNIASGYLKLENIDEALKYFKKGLEIDKKIYTSNNSELKKSYYMTGMCYFKQNKQDQALKCLIRALSNTEVSANMSFDDCCIVNNIANIYADKGKFKKAHRIFKLCLESARTNKFGEEHTQVYTHNIQETERAMKMVTEIRSIPGTECISYEEISQILMLDLISTSLYQEFQ